MILAENKACQYCSHSKGNHNFINFTEPLKTERGELAPIGPDASYLSDADACAIATRE